MQHDGQGKLLLIVDDDDEVREVLALGLEGFNFRTADARDGYEALDSIKADRPDAIISDYEMPLCDGLALLRILKQDSSFSQIPFFMMTGSLKWTENDFGLFGAAGLFHKPFDFSLLASRILHCFAASYVSKKM